jgi:hypothetical protein
VLAEVADFDLHAHELQLTLLGPRRHPNESATTR